MKKLLLTSAVAIAIAAAAYVAFWNDESNPNTDARTSAVTTADEPGTSRASGDGTSNPAVAPTYHPSPDISESELPVKDRIAEYGPLSEDDPSVALDLATTIIGCAFVTDEPTVDSMLDESLQSAQSAERMAALNDSCEGVTDDDYLLALELVDQAAAAGLPQAQVEYEVVGAQVLDRESFSLDVEKLAEYRTKSLDYLNRAASSGHAPAMYRLSFLYSEGHLVQRNAQRALQHFRAYLAASGNNTQLSMERLRQLEAAAAAQSN